MPFIPGRSMSSSRTSGRSTGASARASWALAASPTNSTSGAVSAWRTADRTRAWSSTSITRSLPSISLMPRSSCLGHVTGHGHHELHGRATRGLRHHSQVATHEPSPLFHALHAEPFTARLVGTEATAVVDDLQHEPAVRNLGVDAHNGCVGVP